MKYVLTGSLGNITKPLAKQLIAAGHQVTIISSNPERSDAITKLGATPAIGRVDDADFLTKTFTGADAVYTMVPPTLSAPDWKKHIAVTGKVYATALRAAGIKKVVNLSSLGAHMPEGCGPVSGLHFAEEALNTLSGADIKHLRPAFFYLNLLNSIGMIKSAGIYGNNYSADRLIPMVHPVDIAAVAAEELLSLKFTGKSPRYIVSDERTSKEIAAVLGAVVGKPDLPYVAFSDEDTLQGMLQAGLPEEAARNYVEMGSAIRSGEMSADFNRNKVISGKTKLEDFAKEFAAAYNNAPTAVHA